MSIAHSEARTFCTFTPVLKPNSKRIKSMWISIYVVLTIKKLQIIHLVWSWVTIVTGYTWTDGSPTEYVNWENGQPDPDEAQNCVQMTYSAAGKWSNTFCSTPKSWICKIRRGKPLYHYGLKRWIYWDNNLL